MFQVCEDKTGDNNNDSNNADEIIQQSTYENNNASSGSHTHWQFLGNQVQQIVYDERIVDNNANAIVQQFRGEINYVVPGIYYGDTPWQYLANQSQQGMYQERTENYNAHGI
ncbi:PREDICTED: uncharacterized protein LOC105563657 [Vollenhovia emeryi]|uniref:uncharacterized protein LOC105563657 n=1 Tax=Vollenhovia emeryi TaxID=411798 RepID=UPI0005F4ABD2|nr:PREDICTED: uncharacterized protein LOC105563657 [Vollenhovia emeryi]